MRIVITGASGFVGGLLIPLLLEKGHTLLLVSRDLERMKVNYPLLSSVRPEEWAKFGADYDLLVHLAVKNTNSIGTSDEFLSVNDRLTRKYAEEAREARIGRFIYASSVHTLDPSRNSPYALSKREGEISAIHGFGPQTIVVHFGAVHGTFFGGKLSFLSRFEPHTANLFSSFLSALAPTTHVSLISQFLETALMQTGSERLIITDPKETNAWYRVWRHLINASFVLFVIILFPLIIMAWTVIVLTDGAPGLFVQKRVGQHGGTFSCFKLRTMRRGTQSKGTHLVEEDSILPLGRFLRATNFDELPQAWNVIRGQMTLIGPRPSLRSQKDLVKMRERLGILSLLPGLTGWAQVNGVDMSRPDLVATLDEQYLHLRSIAMDFRIIVRTLFRR